MFLGFGITGGGTFRFVRLSADATADGTADETAGDPLEVSSTVMVYSSGIF